MTTTIAPSLGHAPVLTQAGTGASPGYDAIDFRRLATIGLQEGVLGVSSFEVTQRSAGGAGMFVDIAANIADALGSGIAAVVQGDAVTAQGLYPVPPHSAIITEAISANASGNPRVDSVILEVLDNTHDASGSNLVRVRVLTGTPTSGATLANRTGAVALPSSALLLADVLVATGASSITNSVIRDRRKWARGAHYTTQIFGGTYNTPASLTVVDGTNLQPRIECSGVPLRVVFEATLALNPSAILFTDLFVDGAQISPKQQRNFSNGASSQFQLPICAVWEITPTAGSHLIGPAYNGSGTTGSLVTSASTFGITLHIEEVLRQSTANNPTTTG